MSLRRGSVTQKAKEENRERRSPRTLRSKTPSINELRKKFKVSPKGKRKLDFLTKKGPLVGKSFYLDLQGYRQSTVQLKKAIRDLDGVVEEFFHKDVTYLVTNRKDIDNGKSPSSHSTPSPGTPSPFLLTRSSSVKGAAIPSPMSTDSPRSVDSRQTRSSRDTRGQKICNSASAGLKKGTTDVMSNASTWGVNVLHMEQVLKWILQLMPKSRQRNSMQYNDKRPLSLTMKRLTQGKVLKVVTLQDTYLKVEDLSFKYRPLVYQFKEWPEITFDGSVSSPFDHPRKESENTNLKKKSKVETKITKRVSVQARPKHGYCECCEVRYTSLDSHLRGEQHRKFARTESNYVSLNKAISEGPNIEDLVNEVRRKNLEKSSSIAETKRSFSDGDGQLPRAEEINDDVLLLSSPCRKSWEKRDDIPQQKPSSENALTEEENKLDSASIARFEKNSCGSVVIEDLQKCDSLDCDLGLGGKRSATLEESCVTADARPCTRSRVSPKLSSGLSVSKDNGKAPKTAIDECESSTRFSVKPSEVTIKENDDVFVNDGKTNLGVQDRKSSDSVVRGMEQDHRQLFCSSRHVKILDDISNEKLALSYCPGALVVIDGEEVKNIHSDFGKRRSKHREELPFSSISPCNSAAGLSISSSDEAAFFPSGVPIYSSLGSAGFGYLSKDVNSLVNKFENHSNSGCISENLDANDSVVATSPNFKLQQREPCVTLCSESIKEVESHSVLHHGSNDKTENCSLQVAISLFDVNDILKHKPVGNQADTPFKRKRLPIDDEENTKVTKCKRVSNDHDLENRKGYKSEYFSSGYTSESESRDVFRSCVAERVKLQRALLESMQECNKFISSVEESKSPQVTATRPMEENNSPAQMTVTNRKCRDVFTSSPFTELTNTCRKGRERAKSDGRLWESHQKSKSGNKRNKKARIKQPRSACLTPNDPYNFDDS